MSSTTTIQTLAPQLSTQIAETDKRRLGRLRRKAQRYDLRLEKSRQQLHLDNRGGLMLVDAYENTVIAGASYDLDLDQAEEWIEAMLRR